MSESVVDDGDCLHTHNLLLHMAQRHGGVRHACSCALSEDQVLSKGTRYHGYFAAPDLGAFSIRTGALDSVR